jgi:hypothetical protein
MARKAEDDGPASKAPLSHGRLRAFLQRTDAESGAQGPNTLPPPPFENEASVQGLEWWLDAHMSLASELVWLEQNSDAGVDGPPSSGQREGHFEALRSLAEQASDVRDALYELYCDAADPRLSVLLAPDAAGAPLEAYVRTSYDWCGRVVKLLGRITTDLRAPGGPDWNVAKSAFREAARHYPGDGDAARTAVQGLPIDYSIPVEPLRHLPSNLEQLLESAAELQSRLAKRFA